MTRLNQYIIANNTLCVKNTLKIKLFFYFSKSIIFNVASSNSPSPYLPKIKYISDFLEITCIRDVKTGKYASVPKDDNSKEILFAGKSTGSLQDRTLSIYYGPDFCSIQIINFVSVAENAVDIIQSWTNFLFKCITNQRMLNLSPWENLVKLRSCLLYGRAVMDSKSHEFKLPVKTLVDSLVSSGKSSEAERNKVYAALHSVGLPYGKNDLMDEKYFSIEKFFKLIVTLTSTRDIDPIFLNYWKDATKSKQYLNAEKFEQFLNKEQRDPSLNELLYPFYSLQKATELIQKFEIDDSFRKKKKLSSEGLLRYLMDFENEVVDPKKYELQDHDMNHPLSHYFINSSHNTYLTGHQLTGKSDPEMYRQVLLSGCRCIELDCHEDDSSDEPIITHGRTWFYLINKKYFPILQTNVNRNGNGQNFSRSVSDQNEKSCSISSESNQEANLPRMESVATNSDSSDSEKDEALYKKPVGPHLSSISDSSGNQEVSTIEMAQLVNYLQPATFRSFEIAQRKNRTYEMFSFVETSAFNLHKDKSCEFVNYNKRQFSRIYPKGTRISSDNFIPQKEI
ncbi:1-phosphatidylinositol 4-5-bisphosphate phosphodiesterase classes I and II-like [Brachionus plicatilis]|uniref:Phosphoinositide phospholipase C n=1 Tax=Brachionus plicatilis TaxID=10195 RepID=A0A3M7QUV6_BRAPC|nr:1-phosphatidylinositol 4-5-bisphosphate phosphodiesterase classes I and II-like [Brachionus plicatilis]